MTNMSKSVHLVTTWAKARLDEIDAGVTSMERRMATIADESKVKAHLALMDAKKSRESFRALTDGLGRALDRSIATVQADLEKNWSEFEAASERWLEAMGEYAGAECLAYSGAQIEAWDALVNEHRKRVDGATPALRPQLSAALRHVEEAAGHQKQRFHDLQTAGSATVSAWSQALKESRTAFSKALQVTHASFAK